MNCSLEVLLVLELLVCVLSHFIIDSKSVDITYASVAGCEERNLAELRASKNNKLMVFTSETLNNDENHSKLKEGQFIIEPPRGDIETKVTFRCKNMMNGWIENPPVNDRKSTT